MTEQCFTTSFDSPKDQEDAADIKSRTVVMTFSRALLGGMFPLDSLCVGAALTEVVSVADVTALGSLRGNHEWHVTLATRAAAEALLETGRLRVKGPHGAMREADLRPLVPTEVFIRVLWCPAWIYQDIVYELLASIGEVVEFERSRSRVGEFAIPNLQYTATLKRVTPSQVPDRITLEAFGEKVPILLITKGKPRCCFLCGSCSHTQSSCPNPYCRYCHKRGHVVTNCPRKRQQNTGQPRPEQTATTEAAEQPAAQSAAQPAAQPAVQPVAQPAVQPAAQPGTSTQPTVIPETPRTPDTAGPSAIPTSAEEMDLAVDRDKRKRVIQTTDKEDEPKSVKKRETVRVGVLAVLPKAASLTLTPTPVDTGSTYTESEVEEGGGA